MYRNLIISLLSLLLVSCAATKLHNPLPEGYTGPTATVKDYFRRYASTKWFLYYIDEVDGKKIASVYSEIGKNGYIVPSPYVRNFPAKKMSVKLIARTYHTANFISLFSDRFLVEGIVEFEPKPGKTYIVRGLLNKKDQSVWIEDYDTGEVMTKKIIPPVDKKMDTEPSNS